MATLSFVYSRDCGGDEGGGHVEGNGGNSGGDHHAAHAIRVPARSNPTSPGSPAGTQSSSHSRHTSPRSDSGRLPYLKTGPPPATAPAALGSGGLHSTKSTLSPYSFGSFTTRNAARRPYLRSLDEALHTQELADSTRLSAQQRVREARHAVYACPNYGPPQLRAEYMMDHRQSLLATIHAHEQQRRQGEEAHREEHRGVLMSDAAFVAERRAMEHEHSMALHQFRDGNKMMIEAREQQRRAAREQQSRYEQGLLRLDPVNWSKTLT